MTVCVCSLCQNIDKDDAEDDCDDVVCVCSLCQNIDKDDAEDDCDDSLCVQFMSEHRQG